MALAGRTPPRRKGGLPCSVATLLDGLSRPEREALRAMLTNPAWSSPAIHDACVEESYDVARSAIAHHRRGDCACSRP